MNTNSIEERRSSYEQGFSAQRVDAELLSPDFSSKRPFDSSPDLARHLDQSLSLSSDSFYSEPRHVEPYDFLSSTFSLFEKGGGG